MGSRAHDREPLYLAFLMGQSGLFIFLKQFISMRKGHTKGQQEVNPNKKQTAKHKQIQ